MGVIYKLKDDVKLFIIDQKKNNPTISVRQLAILTSETFQIKVSKSSVSTTLKGASLSSSVGRRTSSMKKGEKFSIPDSRKNEISKNMNKAGFQKKKPLLQVKEAVQENIVKEKITDAIVKDLEINTGQDQKAVEETALPLIPDLLKQESRDELEEKESDKCEDSGAQEESSLSEQVDEFHARKNKNSVTISKGIGFIFLKAAQWELTSKPLMAELLAKYDVEPLAENIDAASEMFLYFKFLGHEQFESISGYEDHGLWKLNSAPGSVVDEQSTMNKVSEIYQWCDSADDAKKTGVLLEYDLEKKHILSDVSGYKLLLEDGNEAIIDSSISTVHMNGAMRDLASECLPINKAMTWLSNYLISNKESMVFHRIPGKLKFDRGFYDFIEILQCFEGKKILKAQVLDKTDSVLAEFTVIPNQIRTFLGGVYPEQKEFAELTKSAKWAAKKGYYHKGSDSIVYYAENTTDCLTEQFKEKMEEFRVITLWRENEKEPFWAILTNLLDASGEDILEKYSSRWPDYDANREDSARSAGQNSVATQESGIYDFLQIFADFGNTLSKHCQRYFFPPAFSRIDISRLIEIVYSSPGKYFEEDDEVIVSIDCSGSGIDRKEFEGIADQINRRHICDYYGRRLWLEIQ